MCKTSSLFVDSLKCCLWHSGVYRAKNEYLEHPRVTLSAYTDFLRKRTIGSREKTPSFPTGCLQMADKRYFQMCRYYLHKRTHAVLFSFVKQLTYAFSLYSLKITKQGQPCHTLSLILKELFMTLDLVNSSQKTWHFFI